MSDPCDGEDEVGDDDRNAERLERIGDEFAARLRDGDPVTVDEAVAAHPGLEERLRPLLASIVAVESFKSRRLGVLGQATARLPIGSRIGDFRIVREVGRGGMGVVYEAEQESLSRIVALKVLPNSAFLDESQVARFQHEARTVSRLWHPHIVPVHTVGLDGAVHYFAMPLIPGVGLDRVAAWLAAQPTERAQPDAALAAVLAVLDVGDGADWWSRLATIGAELADALDHAHRHGVLHRDVKPANVLIEPGGKAWITDFGVAKSLEHERLTRSGDLPGTLHYVPPESFDGNFDARGDVYGLGLTLLEVAARTPAWPRCSVPALVEHVRRGVPRTLRQWCARAPRDLSIVLAKATAREPADRYADAAAFAADLRRFATGQPIAARSTSTLARVRSWCRRNRLAAVLAAGVAAAVGVAAVTGWAAYWTTREALIAEGAANAATKSALASAENATSRAESNLALALASYDSMFAAIVGASVQVEPEPGGVPILPPLSPKDLELLKVVLSFYESFASGNLAHPRLRRDAARAFTRAGDIRRWTGDFDGASAAYERGIAWQEKVAAADRDDDWVVTMVALRTGLALLRPEDSERFLGSSELERARTLLNERLARQDSPRLRLELARLCNTIGVVSTRSVPTEVPFGPPFVLWIRQAAERSHQEAATLARGLLAASPDDSTCRLLLARSLRLLAQLRLEAGAEAATLSEITDSLAALEELANAAPDDVRCRVEWIDACSLAARHGVPADGAEPLARSLAAARSLVKTRPGMPDFEELLAKVLRRCGEAAVASGRHDQASVHLAECAELRASLVARFPRATHHLLELLEVRRAQAAAVAANGDVATARILLELAVQAGDAVATPRIAFALHAVERDLALSYDCAGDHEAAEAVLQRSFDRRRTLHRHFGLR